MSYTIIYEKQFIKVSDSKVIPMIIIGDNNVWMNSGINERRARDPHCPIIDGKVAVTLEEIKADLERIHTKYFDPRKEITATRSEKDFGVCSAIAMYGKGTGGTTWKMYENLYLNGYKQALTVEQLRDHMSISVVVSRRGTKLIPELDLLTKRGFETSEELNDYIEMVDKVIKEKGQGAYTYKCKVDGWDIENVCKKLRRKHFPIVKKSKVPTEVDSYYAITINRHNYLVKSQKGGLMYTMLEGDSKPFATEKAAVAALDRLKKRNWSCEFGVIKINEKRTILV